MTVRFGFGLITCQRYPGDARSDTELYGQAIDLAALAEDLGFDSVWVSEHHFVDDAYLPSLLPLCAAIAARTARVQIGTALLLAPMYDAIRLAEDAAVVDLISGGRLILGLGLGWREEEFEVLGVPIGERAARMEDTVTVLRQAWSGAPVTGGSTISYPGPYVTPAPHAPGGPPVWIGAISPPAVTRAGRIADGFMATSPSEEGFARRIGWARDGLALAGRDGAEFALSAHLPAFPWEGDPEEAWEAVRPFAHYVSWKYDDMEDARARTGPRPRSRRRSGPKRRSCFADGRWSGRRSRWRTGSPAWPVLPTATCTSSPACTGPGCRSTGSARRCACSRRPSSRASVPRLTRRAGHA